MYFVALLLRCRLAGKNTKYEMRNDLSISMTEPINLSDPDVRELTYRGVRLHRSLDLSSYAQHFSHATAQVLFTLKRIDKDSFT